MRRLTRTEGYLTVYLTLILTIVLSLYLALIEGARQNAFFLESECALDVGLNSVLAEYHRGLYERYNLFAIDTSYGNATPYLDNTRRHLSKYVEMNLSSEGVMLDWLLYKDFVAAFPDKVSITGARYMTDANGAVFRRRAAEAMGDEYNLDLYEELQNWLGVVESNKLTERDIAAEKRKLDKKLQSYDGEIRYINEKEFVTISVTNPTEALEKLRKKGILYLVCHNPGAISSKAVNLTNLVEKRAKAGEVNQGNIDLEEQSNLTISLERFLFQEYLMHYMGHYNASVPDSALDYQIEYLIAGGSSDIANLKTVTGLLLGVREVANTIYLLEDEFSVALVETLATALAALMGIPEASEILEGIIIMGWAFSESVYDVQCLLEGERIPLMKDSESWHYGLDAALTFNILKPHEPELAGLSYEDYLRIMMSVMNEDKLTMRAMNMIEADIRLMDGNECFRVDGCVDCLEAEVQYKSAYGYQCEIKRKKAYSTQ